MDTDEMLEELTQLQEIIGETPLWKTDSILVTLYERIGKLKFKIHPWNEED